MKPLLDMYDPFVPQGGLLEGGWSKSPELVDRMTMLPIGQYEDGSLTLAWPSMLKDMYEGAARSYLAQEGPPIYDDGGVWVSGANMQPLDAFNAASIAPIGAFGARAAGLTRDVGDLGMFAGRGAKTADHAKLAQAERMASEGAPRDQIWNDTGWFKGVDDKWRFEIDDSSARFNPATGVVGDALDHPGLLSAYPEMSNYPLTIKPDLSGARGSFLDGAVEIRSGAPSSTILHELQHGVQQTEGFARGGNHLTLPKQRYDAAYDRIVGPIKTQLDGLRARQRNLLAENIASFTDPKGQSLFGGAKGATLRRREEIKRELSALEKGIADARTRMAAAEDTITADGLGPITIDEIDGYYRSLAGEAEARTVQARQALTPMQRAARPPWLDYDVPESDQVVKLFANDSRSSLPAIVTQGVESAPLETISGAATKYGSEVVPTPVHGYELDDVMSRLGDDVVEAMFGRGEVVQGFLTSTGRFVDRAEATRLTNASRPLESSDLAPWKQRGPNGEILFANPSTSSLPSLLLNSQDGDQYFTQDILRQYGLLGP